MRTSASVESGARLSACTTGSKADDAALVQRSHDLVGDADIDAALGIALHVRPPQGKAAVAAARALFRASCAVDGFVDVLRIAGNADGAEKGGGSPRPGRTASG